MSQLAFRVIRPNLWQLWREGEGWNNTFHWFRDDDLLSFVNERFVERGWPTITRHLLFINFWPIVYESRLDWCDQNGTHLANSVNDGHLLGAEQVFVGYGFGARVMQAVERGVHHIEKDDQKRKFVGYGIGATRGLAIDVDDLVWDPWAPVTL